MPLQKARRRRNRIAIALSIAATLFGLAWLVLILGGKAWAVCRWRCSPR
jgi:hypothetical protein